MLYRVEIRPSFLGPVGSIMLGEGSGGGEEDWRVEGDEVFWLFRSKSDYDKQQTLKSRWRTKMEQKKHGRRSSG